MSEIECVNIENIENTQPRLFLVHIHDDRPVEWRNCPTREAFLSGKLKWTCSVDGFTGGWYTQPLMRFDMRVIGEIFNGTSKYFVLQK